MRRRKPTRAEREVAVAKWIHDAYPATEAALARLIEATDGGLPSGRSWHRDLLRCAALPLDGVRPAILAEATVVGLSRLGRFRHAHERFTYGMARGNVAVAEEAIPRAAAEVEEFCRSAGLRDPARPPRFPHPA